MKTHFAYRNLADETGCTAEWGITLCGLVSEEIPVTDRSSSVTCQNCLRVIDRPSHHQPTTPLNKR